MPKSRIRSSLQDLDAARGNRAHRQLGMAGHAELADEKDIEGHASALATSTDRHAAARQRQHQDVRSPGVLAARPAGFRRINAIVEAHVSLLGRA